MALVVLATTVVAVLQLFGGGLRLARTAGDHADAALLASAKLAELEPGPLTEGAIEGVEGPYRWIRRVTLDPSLLPVQLETPETGARAAGAGERGGSVGAGPPLRAGHAPRLAGHPMSRDAVGSRGLRRDGRGFTLLEVILAVSILAVVVVLATAALRVGLRAWESGQRRADLQQESRALVELVSEALAGASAYRGRSG